MNQVELNIALEKASKIVLMISLISLLISSIAYMKIFKKMNLPAATGLFPVVNIFITGLMVDMNILLALLNAFFYISNLVIATPEIAMIVNALLVPVNAIYFNKLAKAFGKSKAYAAGLFFFSPLFLLIMAFDKSTYNLVKEDETSSEIDYAIKNVGFNENYNPYNVGNESFKNEEEKL